MADKKYASLESLQTFKENLDNVYADKVHTHNIDEIVDYVIDTELSPTSTNPIQNKVLNAEFEAISDSMGALELVIDEMGEELSESYETKIDASAKLDESKTYTDNAISQKSQVQIITWEVDD